MRAEKDGKDGTTKPIWQQTTCPRRLPYVRPTGQVCCVQQDTGIRRWPVCLHCLRCYTYHVHLSWATASRSQAHLSSRHAYVRELVTVDATSCHTCQTTPANLLHDCTSKCQLLSIIMACSQVIDYVACCMQASEEQCRTSLIHALRSRDEQITNHHHSSTQRVVSSSSARNTAFDKTGHALIGWSKTHVLR